MKLYYSPGACSLASHIVAQEAGIKLDLAKVNLGTKKTDSGADFVAINAKGYVPALTLDDGSLLTEGTAIVQYLADLKPGAKLAPANGTFERYRLQSLLGYINSELHKSYGPLFNPAISAEAKAERHAYLQKRYAYIEKELQGKSYLTGESFSIADAYLFTVTNWAAKLHVDLSAFPNLTGFQKRVAARPAVVAAMTAEGLIK